MKEAGGAEPMGPDDWKRLGEFCTRCRAAYGGRDPGAITIAEAEAGAMAWDDRLAGVEQSDRVLLARAHLLVDVVEMEGQGVGAQWSRWAGPEEEAAARKVAEGLLEGPGRGEIEEAVERAVAGLLAKGRGRGHNGGPDPEAVARQIVPVAAPAAGAVDQALAWEEAWGFRLRRLDRGAVAAARQRMEAGAGGGGS